MDICKSVISISFSNDPCSDTCHDILPNERYPDTRLRLVCLVVLAKKCIQVLLFVCFQLARGHEDHMMNLRVMRLIKKYQRTAT